MILDGEFFAKQIREEVKQEVDQLKKKNIFPKLAVISIGEDNRNKIYLKRKRLACEEVGVLFEEYEYNENVTKETLAERIDKLNQDGTVHGILIQHPLPNHFNEVELFNLVDEKKDVDGFTFLNCGKLFDGQKGFIPCTARGIMYLLKKYNIPITGKHVVIVGRSKVVGKPLALLFLQENATVTILHSKSKDTEQMIKCADILVSAVGIPKFIKKDMVKENSVIIDVGINDCNGKIVGDVDFQDVLQKASYITPVPKGVGPMTIAMLLQNVVEAAKENAN